VRLSEQNEDVVAIDSKNLLQPTERARDDRTNLFRSLPALIEDAIDIRR
jgi:hypothetical protein